MWRSEVGLVWSREGVTGLDGASLKADLEPLDALFGGAVCEGFGLNAASGALLERVISDGGSGVEALFKIASFQEFFATVSEVRPDSGVAVGLQL